MSLKKGDVCFHIVWDGKKVEFWEYVLRTIQVRGGVQFGYWWPKFPGVTWGKRSSKHGDFGWLHSAPAEFRVKHGTERGRPYAASRLGALRQEIADLRAKIKDDGEDYSDDSDEGVSLGDRLKSAIAAQKRMRAKT
jgi:hypothetical protein